MLIYSILFYLFSFLLLVSAIGVVTVRNPVYSVLLLIVSFFNAAGLFILLGAEFLAMVLVIVYVGAIAVLFLFVVMMLNVNFEQLKIRYHKLLPFALVIGAVFFLDLFLVINKSVFQHLQFYNKYKEYNEEYVSVPFAELNYPIAEDISNTQALGEILYTDYFVAFQTAGLILLVGIIGAIVLTLRNAKIVRRQNISEQVSHNKASSIELVKVKNRSGIDV